MSQLAAQSPFNPTFHRFQQIDCADEIYDQPVTHYLGKLVFTYKWIAVCIKDCQYRIGST
jgi:hypothetical protein